MKPDGGERKDSAQPNIHWQPYLEGSLLRLRPLKEVDFEALFNVASDPLIWEQHPEKDRYSPQKFSIYFREGIKSKGALAILDRKTSQMIGSSRYIDYEPIKSQVEIGYSFLSRNYWGGVYNRELKALMLEYAFHIVDRVVFSVGERNIRSQKALGKIGAEKIDLIDKLLLGGDLRKSLIYQIKKSDLSLSPKI